MVTLTPTRIHLLNLPPSYSCPQHFLDQQRCLFLTSRCANMWLGAAQVHIVHSVGPKIKVKWELIGGGEGHGRHHRRTKSDRITLATSCGSFALSPTFTPTLALIAPLCPVPLEQCL